ncbi:hypothetical protein R6Q59_010887 [Mikania micrantha]|uniref:Uncharacterized protein n=1 Tax=Mikania micrantha TaxID=192012 RepID=A0A5N6N458_9ASTR|nr:hypothetical protein E3N88_25142 [Mikania micrantha]
MKMKIVDGTEDVDGGGESKNGKLQWFQQQQNVAVLDTAVDSDSPVPGGTPTPAIGYSLRVWVLMVTATVVKRIPEAEWLPAVAIRRWRLGAAVGGDGADGRENSGVVVLWLYVCDELRRG